MILYFNCGHPRNLVREYQNSRTTCTHLRTLNHAIEDFPLLVDKGQDKRGPNIKWLLLGHGNIILECVY